jgi:Fic family protein
MKPKYSMTVEQNIFVAKRNIVDYIWKSANLEGLNVTFPDTYAIYEKAKLHDIDVNAVLVINNLKHAWYAVFESINKPLNLELMCKIHYETARGEALAWGELRTGTVGITGTSYKPPIPKKETVERELENLNSIQNPTERAIKTMLWGIKSQLFWDGNKRTSMLIANKIMIENGCGIISVPNECIHDFNVVLIDYYSNDTLDKAMNFVYDNCIDGLNFENEQTVHSNAEPECDDEDLEM